MTQATRTEATNWMRAAASGDSLCSGEVQQRRGRAMSRGQSTATIGQRRATSIFGGEFPIRHRGGGGDLHRRRG
ncbi:unnamed protein product [Cuscuta campestris]|uniref:Uncharacterized protein n=1 Tax=Cuscuta campestris TaxID=132261 RepID=A0A484KVL2_9ASTE|nr:unnamed protein product [Cuscuta campestris]